MELGERYLSNENSHNFHDTFTPQKRLTKSPIKNSHTHKKLTYFPGPYSTESFLKVKRQEDYSYAWPICLLKSKHVSRNLAASPCDLHINIL